MVPNSQHFKEGIILFCIYENTTSYIFFFVLLREPLGLKNKCLQEDFLLLEGKISMNVRLFLTLLKNLMP